MTKRWSSTRSDLTKSKRHASKQRRRKFKKATREHTNVDQTNSWNEPGFIEAFRVMP